MKLQWCWPLILICNGVFSQQLRFKHITGEEGLSSNFVRTIAQDELGFMWFGTQDGLNRYDGYQVRVYKSDPTDSASVSSSDITCLLKVNKELLLVGTRSGLNFFNPVIEKFSTLKNIDRRLESRINVLYPLDSLNILIGSDEGLFQLNLSDRSIKNPFFDTLGKINVRTMCLIDGLVYIGTMEHGLWRMNNKKRLEKLAVKTPDYLKTRKGSFESITHIEEYGGKIYLGTPGAGIFKVDRNLDVEAHISFAALNGNSDVIRDFVIRDSRLFVASGFGVLVHNLISDRTSLYTRDDKPFSLNSNQANCIFVDHQQNFWIGTDLGGVNISFFRSQKFPNSAFNYETAFSNLYSFCEVGRDVLMIGGVECLQELNLETGRYVDHSEVLGSGTALTIAKETDDVYWIGTWGNGLYRYDKRLKKSGNILNNKLGGTIICLFIDGGYVYAGSVADGLFKIDTHTNEVVRFTEKDGLPNPSVNAIFRDSRMNIWLGTYDGGLVKMKGLDRDGRLPIEKVYRNSGRAGEIASNVVFAVNEDRHGNIWAATSMGLSRLNSDGTFESFYEKDGLPNTYLYSLLADSIGNFWMSTNGGLVRFNPSASRSEMNFKTYGIKDGLVNTQFNMGAALLSRSGRMSFGGPNGFNVFRPLKVKENLHAPEVYVVGFKRGGVDVLTDTVMTYKKNMTLNWHENSFQFEVVALDYTDPSKNKFMYRLEGYDRDWSAPTNVRFISYTELPGGKYVFRVKAANNDGIWNEEPYEISITVIPPFWKTMPFYFLALLAAVLIIYLFVQFRMRSVKRLNRLLELKVAERTRQLQEKNRDIMSSIQYARRIQDAILPSRKTIYRKLKKAFILYRPKDVVSGDFYWFAEKNGIKIFAVVDCTGHGVPGAFMSMIGHNMLHQAVLEKGLTDPGEILDSTHHGVQEALRQGHNEVNTNDGMDVSIICIDPVRKVKWAGANRPLVLIGTDGKLVRIDGDKFPVGGVQSNHDRQFITHDVPVGDWAMAYMFSDGYADQFGGDRGKKFMVKRFNTLLLEIHKLDPEEQKRRLEENFSDWRKNHEQVDDVLIVGIEI